MMPAVVFKRWFILKGTIPILLVAAHNVPHIRQGKIKSRDMYTGLIAERLYADLNVWSIIATRKQPDPNWYESSPMRIAIKKLIQEEHICLVIDIHGRKSDHPNLLEICGNTAFHNKFGNIFKDIRRYDLRNSSQLTLSQDLDREGIPSISFEIRKDGRVPYTLESNESFEQLRRLIRRISKKILT